MGWGGILTSFLLNTMCNYVFIFSITFLLRCWFIHTLLTVQLRCDLLDQVPTTLSIKFQVHRWFFSHHLQLCCYHVIKFLLLLTAVTQLTATFLTKTCVTTCNDVVIVSAKFQLRCWFFSHHLQLRCDLLDQVPTTLSIKFQVHRWFPTTLCGVLVFDSVSRAPPPPPASLHIHTTITSHTQTSHTQT